MLNIKKKIVFSQPLPAPAQFFSPGMLQFVSVSQLFAPPEQQQGVTTLTEVVPLMTWPKNYGNDIIN